MSKVTLKQIADITGIALNTIRSRCKRESWPSCGTTIVNHNETKLYAIADLPVDIQQHFNSALSPLTCLAPLADPGRAQHGPTSINRISSNGAGILPAAAAGPDQLSTGRALQASGLLTPTPVSKYAAAVVRIGSGEIVSTETGEVVNLGDSTPQLSDAEIDMELYAGLKDWQRREADHALAVLKDCAGLKGAGLGNYLKTHPEHRASYATLMRWRKDYHEMGLMGLVPGWGNSEGSTSVHAIWCALQGLEPKLTKIDDNVWYAYYKAQYLKEGEPSVKSCWTKTLGYARAREPRLDIAFFPGPTAFDRMLKRTETESAVYMARCGAAAWNKKYGNYIDRDYSALKPGEVIVSDHAQVDVAVMLPNGRVCFPWVTAWRCFKTSKWLGWLHHPEAPNSDHIFQSFYYSVRDWGLCSDVLIDNGKDYRVKDFAGGRKHHKIMLDKKKTSGMLCLLSVTPHFALPYNAQTKPIERDFLKNKEWFSKHMPGYRGGNVVERPEGLADEIKAGRILDWDEYVKLMDIYIQTVGNKMPSEGKVLQGRCPDEAWDADGTEVKRIGADALKLFCMRTSGDITIGRNGVLDSKLDARYWAEWMSGIKGTKVYIRRDIREHQTAWIFRVDNDEYLGKAELTGKVAALARTDVEKEVLKNALARKQQERKIAKAYFNAKDRPAAAESMQHMATGIAAVNELRGYEPGAGKEVKVLRLANTAMDKVIARDPRAAKDRDLRHRRDRAGAGPAE